MIIPKKEALEQNYWLSELVGSLHLDAAKLYTLLSSRAGEEVKLEEYYSLIMVTLHSEGKRIFAQATGVAFLLLLLTNPVAEIAPTIIEGLEFFGTKWRVVFDAVVDDETVHFTVSDAVNSFWVMLGIYPPTMTVDKVNELPGSFDRFYIPSFPMRLDGENPKFEEASFADEAQFERTQE